MQAQLVFHPAEVANGKITPDQSYRIRVEYHTDPGIEGYVHIQTRDDFAFLGRIVLKNQGAGWHTMTGTIKPAGKDFQIAFGSTRTAPGKFVSISSFELLPESAVNDRIVYSSDLSRIQPFRFKFQEAHTGDTDWRSKVPSNVYLHCWKKESVAEFRGEITDGLGSIGVANFNDDISSQILFQFFDEGFGFKAGASIACGFEYRTTNDAEGRVDVRNPKGNDFNVDRRRAARWNGRQMEDRRTDLPPSARRQVSTSAC